MIRWGAIVACLWAGAASAQGGPAEPEAWGCGARPVAAEMAAARDGAAPELETDEASGGEGRTFLRFDRQARSTAVVHAAFGLRLRAAPYHTGPLAADLQVEAEQSIAADPQGRQATAV